MEYPEPWLLCYETNNYSPALSEFFADREIIYPSLPEQLEAAASAGFALVALDMGNVQRYLESGHSLGALRDELLRRNLQCLELANLTFSEDAPGALRDAERFLEIATALDASFVQCSLFGDLKNTVPTIRAVESQLANSGIGLAIEFLPFSPLNSIGSTRRFIQEAGLSTTKIVLDTWHLFFGPDAGPQLATLSVDEIAYVQFNDHAHWRTDDALFETVNHRLLPGAGNFDLDGFCATLKTKGYRGPVSVEVLSSDMRLWSPQQFAQAEYKAAQPFWQ